MEPDPRPVWLMQPQQGSFFTFPPPCSSCSGMSTVTETCCQEGIFLCVPFLHLYLHQCIQPSLLILLKGKHFLRGTDLSRPSKVAAGIYDYLMGLADYEKAVCCGVPEKGKWAGGCLDLIKLCMKS